MRQCGSCKVAKPLTDFNKKGNGYQSRCRQCQKEYYKNYYDTTPKEKQRLLNSNKLQKKKTKEYVDSLKENKPCADCGVSYPPYVMDFDHVGSKTMNISKMRQVNGRDTIDKEISKCELVCANCHRIRTHTRLVNL